MTSRRPTSPRGSAAPVASARRGSRRRPTTSRPSGARGSGSPRPTTRQPAPKKKNRGRRALTFGGGGDGQPRPTISLRALALFIVVLVAFAVVAPTLRYAVAQQEQLRELNADVAEARARNTELQRQLERWRDPGYVQAQARDRLGYVMPGETPYVVVDPETVTGGESQAEAEAAQREAERAAATPWYLRTWESVQVAGESAVGDEDPSGLTVPTEEQTP
ncbi:FtsB family cell division protein [Georgenia alba]|uniref:Septum formation initiator family protein n=1 Tax=Georgenia alba TaxID=2233858 RepID=A0ABW2Q5W7_9MICO